MTNKKINNNFEQESGRSMVEMLGVLAIIGVLSVGGISGYTTAMNKHKANEILNAAAVRAMTVSTQLQSGVTDPTLGEFDSSEKIGGATFTGVDKVGDNQFKLTFGDKPTTDVLKQMQNIAGDNVGVDISRLLYNNDLSSGVDGKNTNVENVENGVYTCKTGFSASSKCEDCDTDYVLKGTSCVACPGGSGTSISNTGTPVPNYSGCKCPADQEWKDGECKSTQKEFKVVGNGDLNHVQARAACTDGWSLAELSDVLTAMGGGCTDKGGYYACDTDALKTKLGWNNNFLWLNTCYNQDCEDKPDDIYSGHAWDVDGDGFVANDLRDTSFDYFALCVRDS